MPLFICQTDLACTASVREVAGSLPGRVIQRLKKREVLVLLSWRSWLRLPRWCQDKWSNRTGNLTVLLSDRYQYRQYFDRWLLKLLLDAVISLQWVNIFSLQCCHMCIIFIPKVLLILYNFKMCSHRTTILSYKVYG